MNVTGFSLKNPYTIISFVLMVAALGAFAFFRTPTDLFPNTVPPQVVVITVYPGANAGDVADKVTRIVEKELNTLGGLKKVTSTSRDEVSSVNAEFDYSKTIGEAVLEVQNVIGRIRAHLPKDVLEPRIYRITDATRTLVTVALSPKPGSTKTLSQIRLLAENQIEDQILTLPGIADVDVFGGHQPEVKVHVDRDRLAANNVPIGEVAAALVRQNVSAPAGTIYSRRNEYLVKTTGEFANLQQIRDLPIRISDKGLLRLSDVARVSLDEAEQRSIYHGNGRPAIAINVLRPDNGPTVSAIQSFKGFMPVLQAQYPDIQFEITDDQQPIIDLNVSGMRNSLGQAVLLTVLVIFAFLADLRAAVVVSVSIPLAFLASLMVLWFSPYTMNMVTLTGMIIAVGLVVDASVVVLENIYRHYRNMKPPDASMAARQGTGEVAPAVTAGMLTTVIVLIPVMFAGGYTQQTMRPLNLMISATLIASLLVALTVVPLMASRLLARPRERRNLLERLFAHTDKGVGFLSGLYLGILRKSLHWRVMTLILAAVFFLVTMKVVKPLIGKELMPRMDTGIVILEFDAASDASPVEVEKTLNRIEEIIYAQPGVTMVSSVVGSEPGQISFGGGGATAQSAKLTINLVDRTQRDETIWQIQDKWRSQLRSFEGVRSFRLTEYGATPVSSTRAPLDVIISGYDPRVISHLADQCLKMLKGVPGLTDVRRSWYFDKTEYHVNVDPALARHYQTTPADVARELKSFVKGIPASAMRLKGYLDIPITVQYAAESIKEPAQLFDAYVSTKFGPVPLRAMATLDSERNQPLITRERLQNIIDITGVNRVYTIGQVAGMVQKRLDGIPLPAGYGIEVSGTMADMKSGNSEMGRALLIGFVFLYILLVALFRSFDQPITIMAAIPLAVAGALWGLLLFDKPMCKPAMMGMIFLGGTIVNNSILLLDFILKARKSGMDKNEAILQSIRLRIRPILMTTGSTVIGLLPLVFEMAVGLERMSPIGVVAGTGLLVGTFLTMIVIPTVYSSLDSLSALTAKVWLSIFGARGAKPSSIQQV
ncbi:MAG: efflux RND transporter permease subunit [Desulfobacterales bacterium]|uniref:Efflux RND transporter permease subunit n=1 Tax=Candidatus Desulfatibia profunda TaxID=2841695 RepID=A0A8J6NTK8_9BACT|nr:efflux RND transporter permease subunit [Candidatus Desulfatibia profunda]MBL7178611.1 efflux RND transporter permease subunit [Desulfobacterales bacterium]